VLTAERPVYVRIGNRAVAVHPSRLTREQRWMRFGVSGAAWGTSSWFRAFITDIMENTAAFDLGGTPDTFKAALYDNDITPDNDVSSANSAYNADQWVTTNNEVFEAGQWAQGGVALTSPDVTNPAADVAMFDADNTASGSAADLANVYGVLVYDDTLASPVADQGVCYNYFGGANSVVNGTFTIAWHANGIGRFTVTAA
jgi:hypothetical protein